MSAKKQGLRIDPSDNVGIVLEDVAAGDAVRFEGISVPALEDIRAPHKIAIEPIPVGERVYKYGCCIGYATRDIPAGAHVHVHNLDAEKLMR